MCVEEREFIEQADTELARVEAALEEAMDCSGTDWDFEIKPGGIIELDFATGGKIIINRHVAAREIWVAAKSGGFHFTPPAGDGGFWQDTRSGESLKEVLVRCIGEQSGKATHLAM
jgi:CyaY protein